MKKNPAAVALGKKSAKSPKRTKEYYQRLSALGNAARKRKKILTEPPKTKK